MNGIYRNPFGGSKPPPYKCPLINHLSSFTIHHHRIMQISPLQPSLMIFSIVSATFSRALSGIR